MGTIAAEEIRTGEIQRAVSSGAITIGSALFPSSDSSARSIACFGQTGSFTRTSAYQAVASTSAVVAPSTTVVGVNYDGPVDLVLPEETSATEILVVDEGGFCSSVNTISASPSSSSPDAPSPTVLSTPYSHLSVRACYSATGSTAGHTVYSYEARVLPPPLLLPQ